MTIEQKIGQLFVCGWDAEAGEDAAQITRHAEYLVKDMQVGGLVLMGRNLSENVLDCRKTVDELQKMSAEPLLMCVDQEGGVVARFQKDVVVLPSAMAHGATGNPEYAYKSSYANAQIMRALGVNWNFAPVADVNINPLNPIIGIRSYGEKTKVVAEFVAAAVRGNNDGGLISAVKHFPGHGDTAVDSHLALPVVPFDRKRIDEVELYPFARAIEAGTPGIMTAHIIFPAIDEQFPATLSHKIMTGVLREQLGYDGLIITDCMEMKAIADNYGAEAAVLAIEAGVDLVLLAHTLETQKAMYEAVLQAVKTGRISEERIEQSLTRIRRTKDRFCRLPDVAAEQVNCAEYQALRDDIAQKAVTVVKNDGAIPLASNQERVLVTGLHFRVEQIGQALAVEFPNAAVVRMQAERALEQAEELAEEYDTIIMLTAPLEPWREKIDVMKQAEVVEIFNRRVKQFIAVAIRDPYDARNFSKVRNYICTYGYSNGMPEALAQVLSGKLQATGKLPVTIPDVAQSVIAENVSEEVLQQYF